MLYVPGSNARAIEKARTLAADGIILDLEDAVAPAAKENARRQVVEAVSAGGFGRRQVFVRVNGMDTPWWADDLFAVAKVAPDAILVPKISTPQQVEAIGQRLLDMRTDLRTRLWVMIETPLAVLNAPAIAGCSKDSETRLDGFVMGVNDLALETRARPVAGRAAFVPWLMQCILAARAHGIEILDGVSNRIDDREAFEQECAQARDLGFDGKTLIHPSQIVPCNAAFTPSADEIRRAKEIVAAFDLPENRGRGAIALGGQMVERLHAEQARRTLAIAEAIAARADEEP
jgi:citrate lyase subunit beta/citryl-CoA lyase